MDIDEWKKSFFILLVFDLAIVFIGLLFYFTVIHGQQNPNIEWTKVVHNGDLIIVKKMPTLGVAGKHIEFFLTDQACQDPENSYYFNWGPRRVEMNCKDGRYTDDDNTLDPPAEFQFVMKGVLSQDNVN